MSWFKKYSDFCIVGAEILLGIIISACSFIKYEEQAVLITVVYTSMLVFKNTLYFALKYIDLEKEHNLLENIDKKLVDDKVMRAYREISCELKPFAEKKLEDLNKCITILTKEHRTGELDKVTYYTSMYKYVDKTRENDKMWALSTGLDNEWDTNDPFEARLVQKLKEADQRNVNTSRIYFISNDNIFKTDKNDPRSYYHLNLLLPYLSETDYPNTTSFAIGKLVYDNLTKQQTELMGRGFCAFDYADESVKDVLVRDIVEQKTKEICGEILFDRQEIQKIRKLFDDLTSVRMLLKKYVFDNANSDAIVYLQRKGIVP